MAYRSRSLVAVLLLVSATFIPASRAADAGGAAWREVYASGQKAIDDGQYDKAVEILAGAEASATSAKGKAPAANGQGLALLRARRYAEALPHFERAIGYDASYAISRKNLGSALVKMYQLGLSDKAALSKAVEVLSPLPEGEASSLAEAKELLANEDKWAQAPAAAAEPAGATWRDLAAEGDAAEEQGHFDFALKCYAKAEGMSKTAGSKSAACNRQGLALMKARKYEDAVTHFTDAVKADASNKTFLNNLGYCQLSLYEKNAGDEHLTAALDALRKVKDIDATYKPETLALAEEYAAKAGMGKAEGEAKEGAAKEAPPADKAAAPAAAAPAASAADTAKK